MASDLWLYTVLVKTVILVAGATIVYFTLRAARRTRDGGLRLLTVGLVFTGIGVLLAGWLPDLIGIDRPTGVAVTSSLCAVGLVFVVYSMFSETPVTMPD